MSRPCNMQHSSGVRKTHTTVKKYRRKGSVVGGHIIYLHIELFYSVMLETQEAGRVDGGLFVPLVPTGATLLLIHTNNNIDRHNKACAVYNPQRFRELQPTVVPEVSVTAARNSCAAHRSNSMGRNSRCDGRERSFSRSSGHDRWCGYCVTIHRQLVYPK